MTGFSPRTATSFTMLHPFLHHVGVKEVWPVFLMNIHIYYFLLSLTRMSSRNGKSRLRAREGVG